MVQNCRNGLASALFLQNIRPQPIEIICYHCQQAAEKFLKDFLALQGEEIKRTHDLMQLNKSCQTYDSDFIKIAETCLLLTDYGVTVRYPFPMDINEADMKIALKNVESIKNLAISKSALA